MALDALQGRGGQHREAQGALSLIERRWAEDKVRRAIASADRAKRKVRFAISGSDRAKRNARRATAGADQAKRGIDATERRRAYVNQASSPS
jgi:hypothetical protein